MTSPSTAPRTLVLLRHAKSAWPDGVDDLDRPLADRGRRDAPVAGAWIAEYVGAPDLAVVSPALRARQTWDLLVDSLGPRVSVRVDPAVYDASASTLYDLVRAADPEVRTLLLVGHNPGMGDLATVLAGLGDETVREAMAGKFPTCAIAVLRFLSDWSAVSGESGDLLDFVVPRG